MRHRRERSKRWKWIHGIHRRVVWVVMSSCMLGGFGGFALHRALDEGGAGAWLAVGAALFAVWPLGWVSTFRVARPLRDLAKVAGELRQGQLASKNRLPRGGLGEEGEVSEALEGLAERVSQQLSDQRALLAAVSHELRSPLARLRVRVEIMRDSGATDELHDGMQSEIDGMDALVADLLAAARIDFEAVRPVRVDAREQAARALAEAGVSASILQGPSLSLVADPTLLVRAIGVLLDNAVRYGGAATSLVVREVDEMVRFEVHDNGPGFAAGEAEMAFQPFWRRPGESHQGAGLGLALVRQIARAHGGSAGASTTDNTVVWLELPVAEGQA